MPHGPADNRRVSHARSVAGRRRAQRIPTDPMSSTPLQADADALAAALEAERRARLHAEHLVARAECRTAETEAALRDSEQRYRAFFESGIFGAAECEPETGRLLRVNSRFCEITGYSRSELLSGDYRPLTHPEDVDRDWRGFVRLVRGELDEFSIDKRVLRKDGDVIWVRAMTRVVRDSAGNPLRTTGIVLDITAAKQAEEERRYVLSSARCLLWLAEVRADETGRFVYWDTQFPDPVAAEAFMPIRREPGVPFFRAWHSARLPEDTERCEALALEALMEDCDYEQDFRVRLADGSLRWMHETVQVKALEPRRRWRLVAVCTDITERKQAEQERERYVREIEGLNQRLQMAMAETHHRVKNNLQTIAALVEMTTAAHGENVPAEELQGLGQHVRGLAAIHDLLTAQAREGGGAEHLSAQAAVAKLLPMLQATVRSRRIVTRLADLRIPTRQATALALIVNELVSNAVKHAPKGDITVRLRAEAGTATLTVEDCGEGFPAGFVPETAANTGLELVLTLARWDLAGEIAFDNRPAGGASVTVRFPVHG